jgi:Nucleotidyltransferase domain
MPQRRNGQPKVVKILCDWAGTTPEKVALYVFGSRARGAARPDSDLDLAVEVSGGSFGPLVWAFVFKRQRCQTTLQPATTGKPNGSDSLDQGPRQNPVQSPRFTANGCPIRVPRRG